MKNEIACANSTSTSASVRTLATLVSANARNQNSDAVAPMKPANSDGRQARAMAMQHGAVADARDRASAAPACITRPTVTVKVAASTKLGSPSDRMAPR